MYVIFPAEELLLMTYGAAVPRLQPRPTLDNLREPLVPIGTRPSPSRTVDPIQNPNVNSLNPSSSLHPNSRLKPSNIDEHLTSQSYDLYPTLKSRESSPLNKSNFNLDVTSDYDQSVDDWYDRQIDQSLNSPYPRDSSPALSQEPGVRSPSRPISPVPSKSNPSTKQKSKPKLTLSLARLGHKQQIEKPESSRVRHDLEIRVANPTFTRENLRQRNYDAFFESGEPVYSLEPKAPQTPLTPETDSALLTGSQQYLSVNPYDTATSPTTPLKPPRSLGFFIRSKSPSGSRSRSADNKASSRPEVSQKETSKSSGGGHRSLFGWKGPRGGSLSPQASMATYTGVLREYGQSSLNEAFKTHNGVTFKLVKTVSDFTEALSHLYEEHAAALQTLVSSFRKKNGDLRKERPACHLTLFHAWETFLQETEADSAASSDVASALSRQVSRPMLDRSFHRKVQSRKIFTHRESFETIIAKTEEKLSKCRIDYKQAYMVHRQNPTQHSLSNYIDAHNAYVQQLQATNAMLETYHSDTIPQLMQELEEIYADLCSIVADAVLQGADIISCKANEQAKRYIDLSNQCKAVSPQQDLTNFVRILPQSPNPPKVPKKPFAPPQPPADSEDPNDFNDNAPPQLRNELVIERNSSIQLRPSVESLKREAVDLEFQIRQLQDTVDQLVRTQIRGIENQLYNKANELQEELSMKKFDLRAKQIHLAAVRAQRELFLAKLDPGSPRGERKFSTVSSTSMKTKWLKAIRSLKPASGSSAQPEKRNGAAAAQSLRPNEDGSHNLQEYTYKKITPCDVCSQILRGHTRQGLRCRICKLNVHADCAPELPKCQAKQKLLRRQKSTSELENRVEVEEEKITEIDQIYRVLKQAGEISGAKSALKRTNPEGIKIQPPKPTQPQQQVKVQDEPTQPQQPQIQTEISGGTSDLQLPPDIPIVNVPECPERTGPRRGPSLKPSATATISVTGTGSQQQSKGLSAPTQDVSSSAYRVPVTIASVPQPIVAQPYPLQYQPIQPAVPTPIPPVAQLVQPQPQPIATTAVLPTAEPGLRRRLFAGFRPLSGFGRVRIRSSQHRSISLPEIDITEPTRPFGQPLMLMKEEEPPSVEEQQPTKKGAPPHSPRRHKLNLRMKSLSLDSPESTELHGNIRRRHPAAGPSSSYYHGGSGGHLEHSTPPSNSSRLHSPSSPSQQRKLLYASRGLRTGSVDLPDDVEKSLSSASTSPCPSPVRQNQKSHRFLPTNLYVVLYNFKARHGDELDLKAGYKVTVIDTSDPDWWKGKCLGRIGYFPSKYCARLNAGEKPLQVLQKITVPDGDRGEKMTLLRDQIVIQVGEEVSGMVMVRSADNRQGFCPVECLQEV